MGRFWNKPVDIQDDHRGHVGHHNLDDFLTGSLTSTSSYESTEYSGSESGFGTPPRRNTPPQDEFAAQQPLRRTRTVSDALRKPPPTAQQPQLRQRTATMSDRPERPRSPGSGSGLQRSNTFSASVGADAGMSAGVAGDDLGSKSLRRTPTTVDDPRMGPPRLNRTNTTGGVDYRNFPGRSNTFRMASGAPPPPLPDKAAWMAPPPPPPKLVSADGEVMPRKKKQSSGTKKSRRSENDMDNEQAEVPMMLDSPDDIMSQRQQQQQQQQPKPRRSRQEAPATFPATDREMDMDEGPVAATRPRAGSRPSRPRMDQMQQQHMAMPVGDGNFI